MTDKEKLVAIRAEIERRVKCHAESSDPLAPAYVSEDNAILSFIYSMQEEPAPKILEDMLNAKTPAESLGISQEEHDRIVDGLIYGKEPEMVDIDDLPKEEPVSEELESWDKFSHIDDAIEDYCRYDSHIVFFTESLNGEPLEEADDREQVESAFKAGAQWQKRKDKQNFKELAVLASHQDGCLALENIQMRLNELIKED